MTSELSRDDAVIERLTQDNDLDLVASLEARCFTNPWSRDMLARQLAESSTTRVFLLHLPEQRVAGFCACWLLVDELHVNTLVVDFPFRRHGLGRRLMRHVLEDAAKHGARRATLEVRESNVAARRLYEGLGFSVTARRPKYYTQPDEDALILWHESLTKLDQPAG
jgi:[ribosomal protein S18]-alanine N-acetyltransferase